MFICNRCGHTFQEPKYVKNGGGDIGEDWPVCPECWDDDCDEARRCKCCDTVKRDINSRSAFGHWEMDCVEGKKKTKRTMLVFTERKTRHEIIIPMRDQTSASVVSALDRLERKYGKLFSQIFASITVDNGSEFSDCEGMERSIYGGKRTTVYYCHPYCASERGSNENQNRMFRRHFPKGTDFRRVPVKQIKSAEDWMNNYPRKQFGYHTSREQFEKYMEDIFGGAMPGDIPRRDGPSLTR